jgi:hypothetical protein
MKEHFVAALLFIALISTASALIEPEKTIVSISGNKAFALPLRIVNDSPEKALIHLSSESLLETSFSVNDFYLNPGEETTIALNIRPPYHKEVYFIKLKMQYSTITEYTEIQAVNGNLTERINLIYRKQNICRNELDELALWIENSTQEKQEVKLNAESQLFAPLIKPELIELNAGEEKLVKLQLHSNESFPLGEYSVAVYLETKNALFSKEVFFDLTECIKPEKEFKLHVLNEGFTLNKKETRKVYFTVENLSEENNEISFAVKSDLKTELSQKKTVLAPHETREYWIEVTAFKSSEKGEHKIELYAFNPFFSLKEKFYVNVRGIHEINAVMLNNHLKIARGHSGIFTLLIENKGDFKEKITIDYPEKENIKMNFSEESFYLNENAEKKVYVSVNPTVYSDTGEKKIKIEVNGIEVVLYFEVTEEGKPLITSGVIDFLSIPERIALNGKETEIKVLIKNISGEKIENVVFWVYGLPEGISFESEIIKEIEKDKISTAQGVFFVDNQKAEKGNYTIKLIFENSKFRQEKEIEMIVMPQEKEEKQKEKNKKDLLTGFVYFNSGEWLGLIVIALIILILLLNPGKKEKQTWVDYRRKTK